MTSMLVIISGELKESANVAGKQMEKSEMNGGGRSKPNTIPISVLFPIIV
jgi:hypothetical protein